MSEYEGWSFAAPARKAPEPIRTPIPAVYKIVTIVTAGAIILGILLSEVFP